MDQISAEFNLAMLSLLSHDVGRISSKSTEGYSLISRRIIHLSTLLVSHRFHVDVNNYFWRRIELDYENFVFYSLMATATYNTQNQ